MLNLVTLPSQQFFKLHLHDLWKYQRRLRQFFVLALWALTMFCRRRQGTKASTTKVAGVFAVKLVAAFYATTIRQCKCTFNTE
jgi:hypothetical protein